MPGWYVHMEAARLAAERLRAGDVPPELGLSPADAQRLGNLAHKWRNYLATGALGPDLFFLLPDFTPPVGGPLIGVADWVLNVWSTIEKHFFAPWDKWMGPIGANDAQLAADLTGGLSQQLAMALDDFSAALTNVMLSAVTRGVDIFGLLGSGVPKGFEESLFFWSDMMHYRRTYEMPHQLFQAALAAEAAATTDDGRANAESLQVFALGWMCHCATDVVGHSFTNAKSGGPFRLHWQRHHLVENHFDSRVYDSRYGTDSYYDTIGTSALHFRIAWRTRSDAPYNGRNDAPAYDYFRDFPKYPLGNAAIDDFSRRQHFSMAPAEMPHHLKAAISEAMKAVYAKPNADITPQILTVNDPNFSDGGRPNGRAMDVMWQILFRFLEHMSSSGFGAKAPPMPQVINEHPFPTPPGGSSMAQDPTRGVDLGEEEITFLDVLLAIFAWIIYIGQVITWLVTVLPSLIIDVATYPAREVLYYAVAMPVYSLLMVSRKLLVMTGFLTPETVETDMGLVTLGRSSQFERQTLIADLNSPTGFAVPAQRFDEPSGRPDRQSARHADPAYPRDTPRDPMPQLLQLLAAAGAPQAIPSAGTQDPYSEWVAPWRYPERDIAGFRLGWEASLTHCGPYTLGEDATSLLTSAATDLTTTAAYETASTPEETEGISRTTLPQDKHMGNPIDYTLYLWSKLNAGTQVPDFNLDSDRGYAWRCWDWNRHVPENDPIDGSDMWACRPKGHKEFDHQQPCTPPAQFDPFTILEHQPPRPAAIHPEHEFDPRHRRLHHYLDGNPVDDPRCEGLHPDAEIRPEDFERAEELPPEGEN